MLVIKVLGTGCRNCVRVQNEVELILKETGIEATIEKVEDIKGIMEYQVMRTPGLVINEKVKSSGRIPKRDEIIKFIQEEL